LEEVSSPNDNERPRESINLSIDRHETRSSTFTKYVVYHIKGTDKNGSIDVFRRFNEFYKMRVALVKRFPGCFIPSIPEKSISLIDDEIVNKRQRYLNEFLRRMGRLPHLYLSE
jgi:sorting nexin-1/2/sorting nexin-4